jgi:leucyl/phenylalanyl-tRNA--protein transferase
MSDVPYLSEHDDFPFPPPGSASPEGVMAVGGNLSPGMLLSAYRRGIFPWFSGADPVLWWSPDPRCVLFPSEVHVSRSMGKLLRRGLFSVTLDARFEEVIRSCRNAARPGAPGTWITPAMLGAYLELHRLGYAHSIEAWAEGELAGGMYGVSLGSLFFGESMFSKRSNGSKAALILFAREMASLGLDLLDCQVYSPHLGTLGARVIPRREFLRLLRRGMERSTRRGPWAGLLKNEPC